MDSFRFTSITIIPLAILNGTLSHAVKTMVENLQNVGLQNAEALKQSVVGMPWSYFILNFIFYMISIWMMGIRTDVPVRKRILLLVLGVLFVGLYLALGLMILPGEWNQLLPELRKTFL